MSMSSWDSNAVTGTKRRIVALVSVMLFASAALAKDAAIDVSKSNIVATFTQSGVPVDSPFTKFSGRIVYDAAKPEASSASIDVDMRSLDIGDEAYNEEVRKPSWFDSAKYPTGTFRSTAIKSLGPNKFEATGKLTIKGRVLTINVPVTVATVGGAAAFDGSFTMSRKAFVIGDPAWGDYVEDKVVVKFRLVQGVK
jgi:polyisoprenoid-binding protein YceI